MTINLQDGTEGLFDILGRVYHAMATIDTAVSTTVAAESQDILTQFKQMTADDLVLNAIVSKAQTAQSNFESAGVTAMSALRTLAREYLIEVTDQDVGGLASRTYVDAIKEVRRQMLLSSDLFDDSAVTVPIATSPSGTDKGVLVVTDLRGDGLEQSHALAETITLTETAGMGVSMQASSGKKKELLAVDWPGKSGTTATLTAATPASGRVTQGSFDTLNADSNLPKDWIPVVGTPGTTIKMTTPEQQTLTVSGTPTGGSYTITWADADSNSQTTAPIAYNAAATVVQAALRLLIGLESVTVTATGTSPDFTHTVVFIGRGGNVSQFTITNSLTGGTTPAVTPATSVAGTAQVYAGTYAVQFDQPGSELTEICYRLTGLKASTAYALNAFVISNGVPTAGVLQFALLDGLGGSVINDDQAAANSFTVACTSLTTGWQAVAQDLVTQPVFRTPATVPDIVYLTVRFSTASAAGEDVYLDQVTLVEMTPFYTGGPLGALFAGRKPFVLDDKFTIAVANDRAGLLHEWLARTFDLATHNILMPVGTATVPDSVVA